MSDVIFNDPAPRARRAWPRVTAGGTTLGVLGTVISVVLTTGVVAAARLSGAGPQPEQVFPASTFAFAKIDLDPSADQKLAVKGFASKFPKAPADDIGGLRDEFVRTALGDAGVELDYDEDVKPWLGSRVGVAAFHDGDVLGTLVAIQVRDRDRAEAAVRKADPEAALVFRGGYALLADAEHVLESAVAELDEGSLAATEPFRSDVASLARDQIAVGWLDNEAFADVLSEWGEQLDGDPSLPEGVREALTGRTVAGFHADEDYLELEIATVGGAGGTRGGGTDLLRRLPDDTVAAASLYDLGGMADGAFANLGALAGGGMFYPLALFGGYEEGGPGDLGDCETAESPGGGYTVTCTCPDGTSYGWGGMPAGSGSGSGSGSGPGSKPTVTAPPQDPCGEEPEESFADDPFGGIVAAFDELRTGLLPMLKEQTAVAFGGLPDDGIDLGVVAGVQAPGNATEPLQKLFGGWFGDAATVRIDGNTVYAASTRAYADKLRAGGSLGETGLFRLAMGDLDDDTSAAVFVNLERVQQLGEDYPEELAPLDAVGLVATESPDRSTMRIRAVAR